VCGLLRSGGAITISEVSCPGPLQAVESSRDHLQAVVWGSGSEYAGWTMLGGCATVTLPQHQCLSEFSSGVTIRSFLDVFLHQVLRHRLPGSSGRREGCQRRESLGRGHGSGSVIRGRWGGSRHRWGQSHKRFEVRVDEVRGAGKTKVLSGVVQGVGWLVSLLSA
jgi:hypothetical protein